MPHFFIKSDNVFTDKEKTIVTISDTETYRHLVKSRRSKVGEKILLIDEQKKQYETRIIEINSSDVVLEVEKSYKSKRELGFELVLAQSPLRSDAQSLIMEKATELGASEVYPIMTDNCAVAKDVVNKKIERWQKIMVEASKQCERASIPKCNKPCSLDEVLEKGFDKVLAFCERNTELSSKKYLEKNPILKDEKVLVIIGPEGGFSKAEFETLSANNIPMITLGDLILKAETAVIVALGNLVYEFVG